MTWPWPWSFLSMPLILIPYLKQAFDNILSEFEPSDSVILVPRAQNVQNAEFWPLIWPWTHMSPQSSVHLSDYGAFCRELSNAASHDSLRPTVREIAGGRDKPPRHSGRASSQGRNHVKKWYGTSVRGALLGEGRHCLKGRPCQNARYWRRNTALGIRDAEYRLPIGRHVKYDSIENESLHRFHLNAGRFFRVQFIWYCGHWETNENTNLYYYWVTPFRPSGRALSPNDSGL